MVFLTNDHGPGASAIGAIYKDPRQIELFFFNALKGNLKMKTLAGISVSAIRTQT